MNLQPVIIIVSIIFIQVPKSKWVGETTDYIILIIIIHVSSSIAVIFTNLKQTQKETMFMGTS